VTRGNLISAKLESGRGGLPAQETARSKMQCKNGTGGEDIGQGEAFKPDEAWQREKGKN